MGRSEQATVIIENGGFIVYMPDKNGKEQYVGRDGFWTRVRQAAAPWKIKKEADAMARDLNDPRSSRWE